jgi:Ser/Thr protein kinase RdoA (MazF antagonist)
MPQIDEILRLYSLGAHTSRIEALGSAGGMSGAQFWRVTVVRGSPDHAQSSLILRRWPKEQPTPERLRYIHAVLEHAVRGGVAVVPTPIHTTSGETFVTHGGHLWELGPWMPGAADYESAPTLAKLRAAMSALASFHVAVSDFDRPTAPSSARLPSTNSGPEPVEESSTQAAGRFNAVQRHYKRLRELVPIQITELSRSIDNTVWPELASLARQFLATLPRAAPRAAAQLEPLVTLTLTMQPCLRDIWHDHVLFKGDEVTGIIDFGAMDFDTPATDIARLLGSLSPFSSGEGRARDSFWRDGLSAYSAVRPLSSAEQLAAGALDVSGTVLAGCNWIRWIYGDGRQFDDQRQVIERFRRIVARIERLN